MVGKFASKRWAALGVAVGLGAAGMVASASPAAAAQSPVEIQTLSLGLTPFVPMTGAVPSATVDNGGVTMGAVRLFGGYFVPAGALAPTGQVNAAATYPNGPAVFGSTFGGDGVTTFGVPDLAGRALVGAGTGPGLTPVAAGEKVGANRVTIDRANMPIAYGGQGTPWARRPAGQGLTYLIRTSGRNATNSTVLFDSLGVVIPYAGGVVPAGWTVADGRVLTIATNPTLYAVLGTTYGGDGATTFALPDLRGRTAVQAGCAYFGCRALGEQFGSESVTLSTANLPDALGGSRVSVDNNTPSLALNFLCNMFGVYPSRTSPGNIDSLEPFIGEIILYAGSADTLNQPRCLGQLLPINSYQALFSVLGTTFGGNGTTTFGLPNLLGAMPVGSGSGAGLDPVQVGQQWGQTSLALWAQPSVWPEPLAPDAPTGATAVASDGEVTVSWTPPVSNGGALLTGYVVTPHIGATAQTPVALPATTTSTTITGLTNGTAYTFTVSATNSAGTGAAATTDAVTPLAPLTVSVGDATVHEGDTGTRTLAFPVTLSSPSTSPVSVTYAVASVSATGGARALPGIDFKSGAPKVLSFAVTGAGTTAVQKFVKVPVYGDATVESPEDVTLTLSSPTGATLGRAIGTGTIVDDDAAAGTRLTISDASVVEGNTGKARTAQFAVTLSEPATATVTVSYRIVPGTASGNYKGGPLPAGTDVRDFLGQVRTLTFKTNTKGVTGVTKPISVAVYPDWASEGDESFTIELLSVTGPVTLADALGAGTVISDDD